MLGVHHGRHAAGVFQVDVHAVRRGHLAHDVVQQFAGAMPGIAVQATHGAGHVAGAGDGVGRGAGGNLAPDHGDAAADIHPAGQDGRDVDGDLRQREHQVLGQVRAGGVAAAAGKFDLDGVRSRRDGTDPGADLADSIRGSQCSARIRGTPSSTPCSMHACAPPGMVSSAGWKMIRTVPPSGDSSCMRCRTRAMPSMVVVWTSWPQAWVTPWFFDANGRPGFLDDRQGVNVPAQGRGDGALADVNASARCPPAGAAAARPLRAAPRACPWCGIP